MLLVIGIVMSVVLLLGFPMFMSMVAASLVALPVFASNINLTFFIQQLVSGISVYVLLAIPMFIFAADIMSAGKTANRLVDLVRAFVGHIYGGLGITVAGTCTLFGAISGSSQATTVAIGRTLRGRLIDSGYKPEDVNGLIVSSANIAVLIPPSITMIMYAVLTGTSVGDLFIAGILPGILIFLMFAVYNYIRARALDIPRTEKTKISEKFAALKEAIIPLGFPVIIVGGIYSGTFSPTEAAAISVLYAFICEVFIFKTLTLRDIYKISLSTATITAAIFILIAAGQAFSWLITYLQIPQILVDMFLGPNPSQLAVLYIVTIFFFIACMFVDQVVAFLILLPIFFPVAMQAGIHPIHLGIVVSIQSAIGGVSPPFGVNIFTACAAFDESYLKVLKGLPAYMIMYLIISLLSIHVPIMSTVFVG
jgi:tripartite ATP-independent transporter DctM subunit